MFLSVLFALAVASGSDTTDCRIDPGASVENLVRLVRSCPNSFDAKKTIWARGERAVPELLSVFEQQPERRDVVLEILLEMGASGDYAVQKLGAKGVEALLRSHRSIARDDIARLRRMGEVATTELLARLYDPDARVRDGAAQYLLQLAAPGTLEPLIVAAERHEDTRVRITAALAVTRISPPRAAPVLVALFQDTSLDLEARAPAARELARIDDDRAFDLVVGLLKDPSVPRWLRWDLAEELRQTGRPRAIEAAKTFGPSGRYGAGNPESSRGAWILAWLVGFSLLLLLILRSHDGGHVRRSDSGLLPRADRIRGSSVCRTSSRRLDSSSDVGPARCFGTVCWGGLRVRHRRWDGIGPPRLLVSAAS
jgi:hypothetical protein